MPSSLRSYLILAAFTLLAACSRGPASLPPAERVLPSELPVAERAAYRHLPVAGAPNFRDMGGFATVDGLRTRWGLLYRSDALSELSPDDVQYLERLQLQRIVDFRVPDEAAEAPDVLTPDLRARYVNMPVGFNDGNYAAFVKRMMSGDTKDLNLQSALVAANAKFVREFTPVFREWLHGLVQTDGAQLFHCTGGKDRTGLAASIFLLSLGVPEDAVMRDYLASNDYLHDKNARSVWKMRIFSLGRADIEGVRYIMGVEPRYLQAAFDTMRQEYGSIDNYLRDGLGVDDEFRAQLRARYLEPVEANTAL